MQLLSIFIAALLYNRQDMIYDLLALVILVLPCVITYMKLAPVLDRKGWTKTALAVRVLSVILALLFIASVVTNAGHPH